MVNKSFALRLQDALAEHMAIAVQVPSSNQEAKAAVDNIHAYADQLYNSLDSTPLADEELAALSGAESVIKMLVNRLSRPESNVTFTAQLRDPVVTPMGLQKSAFVRQPSKTQKITYPKPTSNIRKDARMFSKKSEYPSVQGAA